MSTVARIEQLLPTDRCDRCSARATFKFHIHGAGELLFCDHHEADLPREVVETWTLVAVGFFK